MMDIFIVIGCKTLVRKWVELKLSQMVQFILCGMILLAVFFLCIINSEVNAGFFYKSAAEREKLVQAERAFTDQRVQKLIDFKKKVCDGTDKKFVLINQKASLNSFESCSCYVGEILCTINVCIASWVQ